MRWPAEVATGVGEFLSSQAIKPSQYFDRRHLMLPPQTVYVPAETRESARFAEVYAGVSQSHCTDPGS